MKIEARKKLLLQRWAPWLDRIAQKFAEHPERSGFPDSRVPSEVEWPYSYDMGPDVVPREFAYMLELVYRKGVQQGAHLAMDAAKHRLDYEAAAERWRYPSQHTWATRAMPIDAPRRYRDNKLHTEKISGWVPGALGMPATVRQTTPKETTS